MVQETRGVDDIERDRCGTVSAVIILEELERIHGVVLAAIPKRSRRKSGSATVLKRVTERQGISDKDAQDHEALRSFPEGAAPCEELGFGDSHDICELRLLRDSM